MEFESLRQLFTQKKKRYPEGYPFFLAQKERLEVACNPSCGTQNRWSLLLVANDFDRYANSHSLPRPQDAVVFLARAFVARVRVSLCIKQKRYPRGISFLFGAEGETRKALPCVCFANNRLCSASPSGVRVSPLTFFAQKKKRYPEGYPFFLAQKERLELSRRFPDLRP